MEISLESMNERLNMLAEAVYAIQEQINVLNNCKSSMYDDSELRIELESLDFLSDETLRNFERKLWILREEKFQGYKSKLTGETYYAGLACYVVEARPKKKDWYYTRRVVWLDKKTGAGIFDEIYDRLNRKERTIFKEYDFLPEGPAQALLEVVNLRTGHWTVVKMSEIKFNIGLQESAFTYKRLERTKW